MENLELRNPLHCLRIDPGQGTGLEAWKAVENEECKKINSMSNDQIFDLIHRIILDSFEPIETQYVFYLGSTEIFDFDGWDAAHFFGTTITNILTSIARRLEGNIQLKS